MYYKLKKQDYTLNRSYTYLLPMIIDKQELLGNSRDSILIDVFIGDKKQPHLDNHIFLFTEKLNKPWYDTLHNWIMNLNDFSLCYDIDEKYRMYVFNVPDIYRHSYEMFRKSKFSQMDESYKERILKFHKINTTSEIAQVLYRLEEGYIKLEERLKTSVPRTLELGSLLNLEREMFDEKEMIKITIEKQKQIWD